MNAIILARGQGSKMEGDKPKPLIEVRGKTILAYQLDYLQNSGLFDKIIIALGHRAEENIEFIKANYSQAPVEFSIENEPLGTGGAIKQALQKAESDQVLVLNCDDITDIDLNKLQQIKENTICVAHPQLPFGLVKEEKGKAIFVEKPILDEWVSCGWYIFNKKELLNIIPAKSSIEYDVFPKLKLKLYKHEGFWQTLNTQKDINRFEERDLPSLLK